MKFKSSIYIAGPMTGIDEFNFPEFDKAKKLLKNKGQFDVIISPADQDRDEGFNEKGLTGNENLADLGLDFDEIMIRALKTVIKCDAIYMLEGWENSSGSKAELALAKWARKKIIWEKFYND